MEDLDKFARDRLEPTDRVAEASTAAAVREAFLSACAGKLEKREVGMKLSQKGFHEEAPQTYKDGLKRVSKRCYSFVFDSGKHFARLRPAE